MMWSKNKLRLKGYKRRKKNQKQRKKKKEQLKETRKTQHSSSNQRKGREHLTRNIGD